MSVADLYERVVDLEQRLGLQNEGKVYSERLLALLDAMEFHASGSNDQESVMLDAGALDAHLARLKNMIDHKDDGQSKPLDGTIEEVMARIESQLNSLD
ncbi:MAG: hypothetical protein H8E36_15540 [Rhodospirillaceae bacterium]|nr:hypothetical protein [Rhodospirillaceae bacterium]MBL6931723.1 hypothetical protein [Rhodospirillales bacterium]